MTGVKQTIKITNQHKVQTRHPVPIIHLVQRNSSDENAGVFLKAAQSVDSNHHGQAGAPFGHSSPAVGANSLITNGFIRVEIEFHAAQRFRRRVSESREDVFIQTSL